jgi:seryl-tRNA synthetase
MTAQSGSAKMVPKLIELVRSSATQNGTNHFKPLLMEHIAQKHKLLSIPTNSPRNVAHVGGERSYFMLGSLAKLEQALMRWSMNELIERHQFTPIVVPNILFDHIIERCGFPTKSERSQVYKLAATSDESTLDPDSLKSNDVNKHHACISGTSEFALASIHIGDKICADELPKRYCAKSRCYRAETSSTAKEWGVYRVHYFNKVEMFAFTMPDESKKMHEEFLNIQKDLYSQLDLEYQVLEMPEDDLGLSAKKKYDIEAWMRGRDRFGEISSTSNCEDYQSSRLNIRYQKMVERDNQLQIEQEFVHTVNGTACSSVRTMIAICEQYQTEDGRVKVPKVLVPYMDGNEYLPTKEDAILLNEINLFADSVESITTSAGKMHENVIKRQSE